MQMNIRIILVLTCMACLHVVGGFKTLKPLSHTKLPTGLSSRGEELFSGINHGTADAAAYDRVNSIVYVIGRSSSRLMHVIDIKDPANPVRLFKHKFSVRDGFAQAIDICGGEIAVALATHPDTNKGQVRFYHTYTRNSGATDVVFNGNETVGPHPKHLRYTDDCSTVVVSNEGIAGKDVAGAYLNPEGSMTIIHLEKTGNRSSRMVDFHPYNVGQSNFNMQIRVPSLYMPKSIYSGDTTVAQDLEPEHVTISGDGSKAWVTLRENNAIVEMSLSSSSITRITPLPRKVWDAPIDVSDRDGGIHRRTYAGLQSLRQPGAIACMNVGNKEFLVTADAGGVKHYTALQHGFVWTDYSLGSVIANKIEGDALKANASNDELLGRIMVSSVDGKSPYNGMYSHLEMFGGRGFSIWDSSNMQAPVFDTKGTLEEYMESFYRPVFNTEYVATTSNYTSPEMNRDASSRSQGSYVSSIDVHDDNGTVYLVAGTWSTGTLFLYTVDTSSGQPIPQFQSIHRAGTSDLPWDDLYAQDTVGDLHISTVGIIPSSESPINRTLLFVAATGSGSLSLYEIADDVPVITP